jgi:hypothetical protein
MQNPFLVSTLPAPHPHSNTHDFNPLAVKEVFQERLHTFDPLGKNRHLGQPKANPGHPGKEHEV